MLFGHSVVTSLFRNGEGRGAMLKISKKSDSKSKEQS